MRDLLYVPPGRVEPSSAIGLFVPEFSNPVFAALAEAMEMHAARRASRRSSATPTGRPGASATTCACCSSAASRGWSSSPPRSPTSAGEHSHYAKLLERGARLVFVNGGSEDLDVTSVGVDERAAGTHRDRAPDRARSRAHRLRRRATSTRCRRARRRSGTSTRSGAPRLRDGLVAHSTFTVGGGARRCASCSRPARERPTGVICSSDLMAIGALQEAARLGLRVPRTSRSSASTGSTPRRGRTRR